LRAQSRLVIYWSHDPDCTAIDFAASFGLEKEPFLNAAALSDIRTYAKAKQ